MRKNPGSRLLSVLTALLCTAAVFSSSPAQALCVDPCWSAASALDGEARSFQVHADLNGVDLYAVGQGFATGRIARYRGGQTWNVVGDGIGMAGEVANALAEWDDGSGLDLYAAGNFTTAGGSPATGIAQWDGLNWLPVGGGVTTVGDGVMALAVFDDGGGDALYLTGTFTTSGSEATNFAKWDGTNWTAVGNGPAAMALAVFDDGGGDELYAAGQFTSAGGVAANSIAKWDGSVWSALGSGLLLSGGGTAQVLGLAVHDDGGGDALYAGGNFGLSGATPLGLVARWNGSAWVDVGPGTAWTGPTVKALRSFDDGSGGVLYAGGDFAITILAGNAIEVAIWDGVGWDRQGTISEAAGAGVLALGAFNHPRDSSASTIYAGGAFVIDAQNQAVAHILPEPGAFVAQFAALLGLSVLRRQRRR